MTNKNELVAALAEATDLSKAKAAEVLDSLTSIIAKTLASGGDIRLVGFGTFEVANRKATEGRNPRTGATIKIPASKQPKFRAGKQLKEQVNKNSKKKAA